MDTLTVFVIGMVCFFPLLLIWHMRYEERKEKERKREALERQKRAILKDHENTETVQIYQDWPFTIAAWSTHEEVHIEWTKDPDSGKNNRLVGYRETDGFSKYPYRKPNDSIRIADHRQSGFFDDDISEGDIHYYTFAIKHNNGYANPIRFSIKGLRKRLQDEVSTPEKGNDELGEDGVSEELDTILRQAVNKTKALSKLDKVVESERKKIIAKHRKGEISANEREIRLGILKDQRFSAESRIREM